MTVLMTGDFVACPHCHRNQEDSPVEDFVVPGRIDTPCKEECCWCNEAFYVMQLAADTFRVTAQRPRTIDDYRPSLGGDHESHVFCHLLWHMHRGKGGSLEEWQELGRAWARGMGRL